MATASVAYASGALAWFIPLVSVSGGPSAYGRALLGQGADDLSGIRMLWTTPTWRELLDALYYAFVSPWATWTLAVVMLMLATIGAVRSFRDARASLVVITVAFGPYFLFDVLFQETFTTRYALPLVIPMSFLAAAGARALPRQSGVAIAIAAAMFGAHAGGTSVAAYGRQPAPAFRLFDDMARAARASANTGAAPTLAMDRREALDLRKAMRWSADRVPAFDGQLPSPPMHEWLEAVKFWNSGARGPLWFVADPLRTDIDLIQHGAPIAYRWPLPYPVLIGGARPGEMDWYRIDSPEWYVGEGWALTPEAAGLADVDRRGLAAGSLDAWISSASRNGVLMIGGRSFEDAVGQLTITADGGTVARFDLKPGFFMRMIDLRSVEYRRPDEAQHFTIEASPPSHIGIEQFDVSGSRPIFGYSKGWYENEYNAVTGRRWRWLSDSAEIGFRTQAPRDENAPAAFVLHLEGESSLKYFSRPSRLRIRMRPHVVERAIDGDFSFDTPIPPESRDGVITLETDQTFVPAERWWPRSPDRRHLGLRIFKCELWSVSAPARSRH